MKAVGILHLVVILVSATTVKIVIDRDTVFSPDGVPVDMNFSEGPCGYRCINSVPGCPKSINGNPWVYYGTPPKCYFTGIVFSTGTPCGPDEILAYQQHAPFGICKKFMEEFEVPGGSHPNIPVVCAFGKVYSDILKACVVQMSDFSELG